MADTRNLWRDPKQRATPWTPEDFLPHDTQPEPEPMSDEEHFARTSAMFFALGGVRAKA